MSYSPHKLNSALHTARHQGPPTQAYPRFTVEPPLGPHGKPAVAIMVENIEFAMETLNEKGFTIITEGDLEGDDG